MNPELYNIIYAWTHDMITAEEFKQAMDAYTKEATA